MVQKVAQREKQAGDMIFVRVVSRHSSFSSQACVASAFAGKVNEALAKGDQGSLTKQQVVEALVTYHSEHGTTDDPCTLSGFKFSRDTMSVEGIQAKGRAALELKKANEAKAETERARINSVKAASLAQDPGYLLRAQIGELRCETCPDPGQGREASLSDF